jgi:hypothetical protein
MDTGATLGAAAQRDIEALENAGLVPSTKVFMLPDKSKNRATQKMPLKQNYGKEQEK